ncbi:MAG: hypothetical protein JWQ17_4000 [Tardiphaga sp.]|jgi:hypothetical protein|nr:hypothetical protein [Tardiphaga sp.]
MALQSKILKIPPPPNFDQSPDTTLGDLRFRALLPGEDWERLPQATRQRFSKRLAGGSTVLYTGEVVEVEFSRIGWWLAQIARLIGGPLPTGAETRVPAIVTVTEDATTGGQVWTRIYARRNGFPQVIHSSKRFAGPTGLEEYVGFGVGMALRIVVDGRALLFCSDSYFLQLGWLKFSLPAFLTPGALTVTHSDLGSGEFRFALEIVHPRFGRLVRQSAVFREATS